MFKWLKGKMDIAEGLMDSIVDDKVKAAVDYITGKRSAKEVIAEQVEKKAWEKAAEFLKVKGLKLKGMAWAKAKITVKFGAKGVVFLAKAAVCAKVGAVVAVGVVINGRKPIW